MLVPKIVIRRLKDPASVMRKVARSFAALMQPFCLERNGTGLISVLLSKAPCTSPPHSATTFLERFIENKRGIKDSKNCFFPPPAATIASARTVMASFMNAQAVLNTHGRLTWFPLSAASRIFPNRLSLVERQFRVMFAVSSPSSSHHGLGLDVVQSNLGKSRLAAGSGLAPASSEGVRPHDQLMIVSDLDLTMVDHKDPSHSALLQFNSLWAAEYAHNSLLVYSTGRSPQKYLELRGQVPLLTPAIAILSVGTEIRYGDPLQPDQGWESRLDDAWDRKVVVEEAKKISALQFQDESEQRPHKVSSKVEKKDAESIKDQLAGALKRRGLKVKLIYSGGIDLDVLPQGAGKGEALAYVLKKQRSEGWATRETLVCGDSGNDIELFTVQGVSGVIVGNAMEELVQWYEKHEPKASIHRASRRCAGGIIEAIGHFNLGSHSSPRERFGPSGFKLLLSAVATQVSPGWPQREVVEFAVFVEAWLRGEATKSDTSFQRLVGVISKTSSCVHPWGGEGTLLEALHLVRGKHGNEKDLCTWVDRLNEHDLGGGIFVVTGQVWFQSRKGLRQGLWTTALLKEKVGLPNVVEWVRVHLSPVQN